MKSSRLKIVNTIQILFFVTMVLLTMVILVLEVVHRQQAFKRRANTMRAEYVTHQKNLIKQESDRVFKTINYHRSRVERQTKTIVQQRVYEARAIAQNIFDQNRDKKLADIQRMIVNALRPIRFNQGSGYYFIGRLTDGMTILQADNPKDEGKVHLNIQDSNGQYLIKEMIKICDKKGEGFYEYRWTKPDTDGNGHKKITFVQRFEPFNWFIGTGLYIEDVEARIKAELLEQIAAIHFGDNGYFFISDWQGNSLAHGTQPSLVGTNLWEYQDSKGNKTSQSLIALAQQKNGGYVEFWWRKPDTQKERPKIAYSRGIPEWQWMIGTGVYLDDVEVGITELEKTLDQELFQELRNTALAVAITLLLFFVAFRIINRRLLSDLLHITSFFEQAASEDKEIDLQKVRFAELYQMAGNANSMLRDKKTAEQELRNEKERFEDLAEQLPVAVWEADHQLHLTYANRNASELFGYSSTDLATGLNIPKLLTPEDGVRFKQNLVKHLEDQSRPFDEYQALKRSGETFPAIIHSSPIQRQGEIVGIRGVVVDITERKKAEQVLRQSEQKFRLLADYTNDWEYWLNPEGNYIYISPSCERMTGYRPDEFIANPELMFDLVSPDYAEAVHQHYTDENLDKIPLYTMEFPVRTKKGEEHWLEHHCSPVFDEQGNYAGRRGNIRDITQRKKAEQERLNLEDQLRQKYKMEAVGVMAGGMAHNFNNNLSIILGTIELSKMKIPPNSEVDGYLSNAKIAVLRARDLIQQILTYSRQNIKDKTSIHLPPIIAETLQLLRATTPTTINLQQRISSGSHDLTINADSSQIQECLINLCNNAVYAMEEKGDITITLDSVKLQKQDIPAQYECRPGHYAKLSVQDTGSGMSAATVDKIFDLFFTTKPTDEGTGVGLSTVQGIVSQNGGLITVDSHLGEGTTFELYFPVIEQTQASRTINVSEEMPEGSEHILFIDDDPVLAHMGERMLKAKGYTVSRMSDSTEALKLFAVNADRFDLVITDQTMPGLTGKELIQEIKKIIADIPTIICTGYSSKVDEKSAKELGVSGFLMKPLELPKLLQMVRRVLDEKTGEIR